MSQGPVNSRIEDVAVVVFAKPPDEGKVKTRLARDIGDAMATGLYRCFLADISAMVSDFVARSDAAVTPIVAYNRDAQHAGYAEFRRRGFRFWDQGEGDLGARMAAVSQRCFDAGARRVVIIGADSPTLSPRHLRNALEALDAHDIALGPSFDGGYYLVAMRRASPQIFKGIDWSTDQVLAQTVAACRASSLLCATLEFWYDVDTFGDLIFLKTHLLSVLQECESESVLETARYLEKLDAAGVFS